MTSQLTQIYRNSSPENPYFLSSNANQLFKEVNKNGKKKTLPNVKRFLQTQDVYTLNKNVNRHFNRNHYFVYYINDLWQMDLADVSTYEKENDGIKYLLTIIDALTKFAYVVPLRSKTALEVTRAFRKILNDAKKGIPKAISSDKGKEFKNSHMTNLLNKYGVKQQFLLTTSPFKASIVEIFNKTIKSKIFKYLTATKQRRYIDVLDKIVLSYNSTIHSVTRMAPIEVRPENVPFIYHNTHRKHRNVITTSTQHLQKGDFVRVVRKQSTFQQTFSEKWTREVFIVTKVINKKPYKLYKLIDFNDHELTGKFYDNELQRVYLPPDHIIKTIKYDGARKKYVLLSDGRKIWMKQ